ncbi:MAG TPA: phosphoribosylamine--glycine ligase [Bdellovibrionota bacterium]|nr:phosphoribosylamine--glycine ligase [Bdellovibrionota bacterium]
MRLLLIGSGGREHALCWKLAAGPNVEKIFTAPGNPGTAQVAKNQNIAIPADDIEALVGFASTEGIDLTVVGPEKPLADGIADRFRARNLKIFGPVKAAAQLEASKSFAKNLMNETGIPTADFRTISDVKEAYEYLKSARYPLVLKADGLAAGKGVSICPDAETAKAFAYDSMEKSRFGSAGKTIVAEEFLAGEEASFLVVADGAHYVPLASAQDHKRLLDGDQGPNTGGMGAYSPAPVVTEPLQKEICRTVIEPVLATLAKRGASFVGVLYAGLIVTPSGPRVLEFNVRFGDPEAQAILPRIDSDLSELLMSAVRGKLANTTVAWKKEVALTVVLAAEGYPGNPKSGAEIRGTDSLAPNAVLFHAGTKMQQNRLVTGGGRVFSVTGLGSTFQNAADAAYRAADQIRFDGKICRRDIGWRAIQRKDK